jgi:hypothetical protein
VAGYHETIAAFDTAYRQAYSQKPTWGGPEFANVKRLLAQHGADEVQRRIGILFSAPPAFLKPPHDFKTLVNHFDKLAAPSSGGSRTHGSAAAFDLAMEAEERERARRNQ